MGTGLYDAVFAALGRMYGSEARGPITNLTLFGGFASTICWPLSAFMIDHVGWRVACFIYAALHLCLVLPLQMAVVRRAPPPTSPKLVDRAAAPACDSSSRAGRRNLRPGRAGAVVNRRHRRHCDRELHDLPASDRRRLRGRRQSSAPCSGRRRLARAFVESLFGQRYHPIWTIVASCALMAAGLLMLYGQCSVARRHHPGLCRRLRDLLGWTRHLAAGLVRPAAVSAADGEDRVSQSDRAGLGPVGRRLADRR